MLIFHHHELHQRFVMLILMNLLLIELSCEISLFDSVDNCDVNELEISTYDKADDPKLTLLIFNLFDELIISCLPDKVVLIVDKLLDKLETYIY